MQTKTEYRDYIASEGWQQRRKAFLDQRTYEQCGILHCSRCRVPRWLAAIAYDQDVHVHHKNYQHLGHERAEDLEVLCRRCHEIETFGRSELRPIRAFICAGCGCEHFDPHGPKCESCRMRSLLQFFEDIIVESHLEIRRSAGSEVRA
jgi:hypothetical protein